MPRFKLHPRYETKALRILDKDGNADDSLLPDIDDDSLVSLFRHMLGARRFDERLLKLQRQGSIGTFAPVKGQEASQVGAATCLKDSDWMVPAFRETAAMLLRGVSMENILVFNAGFNEGAAIPDDSTDLPIAVPVASQIPHAAGIAYAAKLRGDPVVAMVFFGDGATSEGDFHEALNFAGVFQLPVVFVCQNNHWAISVPRERQTRSRTIAQKAQSYGFPGIQVDGNDLFAVYAAADNAVERAREGDGPTLIECVTYRMEVHTTADDPDRYRDEEEVEKWAERDPIDRLAAYLKRKELLSDDDIDSMEEELQQKIDAAWESAKTTIERLSKDPLVMFDHIYDELPPHLAAQREAFRKYLKSAG